MVQRCIRLAALTFGVHANDKLQETRTSTLVEYGVPGGYTAMAKLVGIPCGVATKLVLNGTINDKGVIAPMNAKINTPLIEELKKLGIECKEELV
jgi:saccharopine dehydrogenase (NADP+, L-glutamate forming)